MNFDEAVHSHSEWKTKLRRYLQHPDKTLDPGTIELDNHCALGQWLYGDGKKYAADSKFQELKTAHASFHRSAADLIRRADRGDKVSEEAELGAKSVFSDRSQQVVGLIMEMKRKSG